MALRLGISSPEESLQASSSGKLQGSEGGVLDTPGSAESRVLFVEDETKVALFEVQTTNVW